MRKEILLNGVCYVTRISNSVQKSIKIDEYTYNTIMAYSGKNFSDKLRNMIMDFQPQTWKMYYDLARTKR